MTKAPVATISIGESSLHLGLQESLFQSINEKTEARLGRDVLTLANDDPSTAYEAVLLLSGALIEHGGVDAIEGEVAASKHMDGAAATKGLAKSILERARIDTDIEPIDVMVSVFQKPTLWDRIRSRRPSRVVSEFRVEPPSLVNY